MSHFCFSEADSDAEGDAEDEEDEGDGENVGSKRERWRSKFARFCGTFLPSFSGSRVCPMRAARSVPKEVRQTLGGMRPVVVRKKGLC